MQGVRGGASHPPKKKANLAKIDKTEGKKITKSRNFTKTTTMPLTNGSKVKGFQGGNPPHPHFFEIRTPPQKNPAYAPGSHCIFRVFYLSLCLKVIAYYRLTTITYLFGYLCRILWHQMMAIYHSQSLMNPPLICLYSVF